MDRRNTLCCMLCLDGSLVLHDVDCAQLTRSERNRSCDTVTDDVVDSINYILAKRSGFPSAARSISPEREDVPALDPDHSQSASIAGSPPEPEEGDPNKQKEKRQSAPPEPVASTSNTIAAANNDEDTDEDIWAGKRTAGKRAVDLQASTILLVAVKTHWDSISNKKISRRTVWAKVALEVRALGVKITRDETKAWEKVYQRWRKMKESYFNYVNSSGETGKGKVKEPPHYPELHELLGNYFISLFSNYSHFICKFYWFEI